MPKNSKNDEDKLQDETQNISLEKQIEQLEKKLVEQEEIVKRAQSDYFRTKLEFDEYVKRSDAARLGFELDGLITALAKVLPFVTQLKTTLDNTPTELEGNTRAEGVALLYSKMMKDMELLGVKEIEAEIGTDPNYTLHIPIGMEETDNKDLKNKIIKIVESGYIYKKDAVERVIQPTKVMVGS